MHALNLHNGHFFRQIFRRKIWNFMVWYGCWTSRNHPQSRNRSRFKKKISKFISFSLQMVGKWKFKMSKDKEEVVPIAGPGSRIKALAPTVRKHLIYTDENLKVIVDFSTNGIKAFPQEIWKNEEIMNKANRFLGENNRLDRKSVV